MSVREELTSVDPDSSGWRSESCLNRVWNVAAAAVAADGEDYCESGEWMKEEGGSSRWLVTLGCV